MLHEIVGLADEPPAKRRWFHDDYFDLFIWQAVSGEVVRFQLCYGIRNEERALVWHRQGGFYHDGTVPRDEDPGMIIQRFDAAAPTLPKTIRLTVGARLREYATRADQMMSRRKEFRRASWQRRLSPEKRRTS